ncbi:helix-turn-helix domain-containing protein [Leptolyngbya sp. NIES-2104]|uniref:helix-turn-helix domain-containing protein n=1 Tax=Leptolyngbya sp. NIES-2104 TaxID=1552121 RepID=UPI0021F14AFE|nr:helix-turn-helix transcriptional regulator [Leptolyngbya sp. NIES-2104]
MSIVSMGLIRLRIREFADERGWTLKEVAERSGLNYSTVKNYVQRDAMTMTDYTAILKLARAFGVSIEELVEVLEE